MMEIKKEYCTNVTFSCGHRKGVLTYGYRPTKDEIDAMKNRPCGHCYMKAIYDRLDGNIHESTELLKGANT